MSKENTNKEPQHYHQQASDYPQDPKSQRLKSRSKKGGKDQDTESDPSYAGKQQRKLSDTLVFLRKRAVSPPKTIMLPKLRRMDANNRFSPLLEADEDEEQDEYISNQGKESFTAKSTSSLKTALQAGKTKTGKDDQKPAVKARPVAGNSSSTKITSSSTTPLQA